MITTNARWRVSLTSAAARRRGIQAIVDSLKHFAEIETDPQGRRALLQAAATLTDVHCL